MVAKKLNIWTVQIGEPLPIKKGVRKQRMSLLCEKAVDMGHSIIRFASAFDHITKSFYSNEDVEIRIKNNYTLKLFRGLGYKKNISISRIFDHIIVVYKIARNLKVLMNRSQKPDIILVATPPHTIAYRVVKLAKKHKIPVVVDIRDQWPDIFFDWVPPVLHGLCKVLLYFDYYKIKFALSNSTGITAMMEDLLSWGMNYSQRSRSQLDRVFYIGTAAIGTLPPIINNIRLRNVYLECKGKIVFVFIGTFNNYYNPAIVIHVARRIWNEGYQQAIFLLAGDGDYYRSIEETAKDVPNVKLLGWLRQDEITSLLSFSSVGLCTLTQDRAAFPNKVFIYFSAFLPVITSTKGELKELIEKNKIGFFYHPNDIEGLYNCVRKFIEDPWLIKEMRKNVENIFWEKFCDTKIYTAFVEYLELVTENYKKV